MAKLKARPEGYRRLPEKIVLPIREGSPVNSKPPVRIFIGSESAQYRSERVLVWSIEKFRDPGRVYEIFLMKELSGFDRRRWLTGFTNYRFAIPEFAGNEGRAIYNDVDQVYLSDPAELFDHPLGNHGFLSIARNDSSVMVMDCAKMSKIWSLESAKFEKKNILLKRALDIPDLWGKLEPEWNARDEEYQAGHSKVLHYTALHTQPWQPFPQEFVYQKSPVGQVWFDLENEANREGFQLFSRSHPSSLLSEFANQSLAQKGPSQPLLRLPKNEEASHDLQEALDILKARTLLVCHLGAHADFSSEPHSEMALPTSLTASHCDLLNHDPVTGDSSKFDVVVSPEGLQSAPEEDIPWIIDDLFRRANAMVFIQLDDFHRHQTTFPGIPPSGLKKDVEWWLRLLESASARRPGIHWKFYFQTKNSRGVPQRFSRWGGHWIGSPPQIWILSDGKVGHTTQSELLAKALGWPYEIKHLQFLGWHKFQKILWGLFPPNTFGLDKIHSSPILAPWPDLVISTGWRAAPIARWIRQQSQGKTRIVQLGRKGGCTADLFDVVITPSYYGFPPHPRRIETITPLNELHPENLERVVQRWPDLFNKAPHPRLVFVVGGSTSRFKLSPDTARSIATQLKTLAEKCQGKIFAITSPRTGKDICQALESALAPHHVVHQWKPNQSDNPYLAYLAGADVIIVTGESESMLTEAASLGKPVYIIPLPEKPPSWKVKLSEWIVQKAHSQPLNKRGTARPQQGLEHFCALLIRSGLIQPRRNLTLLHESLINKGIARPFGEPIENGKRPRLNETAVIADLAKQTLGILDQR